MIIETKIPKAYIQHRVAKVEKLPNPAPKMRREKVTLGFPWYAAPDVDCYILFFQQMHYFGRLRERCEWINWIGKEYGQAAQIKALNDLPRLDPQQADGEHTEFVLEENTIFEFGVTQLVSYSLPGSAREMLAEAALGDGADWLLTWDHDMQFAWSMFLKLWRHRKMVCASLAFTAREPIQPVIYRIHKARNSHTGQLDYHSEWVHDYPKDQLVGAEELGGSIAFGAGVVLFNTSVFRKLHKPWFHSTGCGEDWLFCLRCHLNNIPIYVDTSAKTLHKRREPRWSGEMEYEEMRRQHPEKYSLLQENQEHDMKVWKESLI